MQAAAVAPKFVLLEEFLFPDELTGVLEHSLSREADFHSGTVVSEGDAYAVDPEHRRGRLLFDAGPYHRLVTDRIRACFGWAMERLQHESFAIADIDSEIAASNDGDFFLPHRDNSDPACSSREISYVYYFYRDPKPFSGGELRIYEEGSWEHDVIVPLQNRLVFFRSWSIHEVAQVQCASRDFADSRFALNGWIHCERR